MAWTALISGVVFTLVYMNSYGYLDPLSSTDPQLATPSTTRPIAQTATPTTTTTTSGTTFTWPFAVFEKKHSQIHQSRNECWVVSGGWLVVGLRHPTSLPKFCQQVDHRRRRLGMELVVLGSPLGPVRLLVVALHHRNLMGQVPLVRAI